VPFEKVVNEAVSVKSELLLEPMSPPFFACSVMVGDVRADPAAFVAIIPPEPAVKLIDPVAAPVVMAAPTDSADVVPEVIETVPAVSVIVPPMERGPSAERLKSVPGAELVLTVNAVAP
jgi:hypothetical protein